MEKEFVPYDLALRLKVLGFDEPCFGYYQKEYHDDGMTELEPSLQMVISKQHQHAYQVCTAPLYQQAFKWFRDNGEDCIVLPTSQFYTPLVYNERTSGKKKELYDTYEEAELACLEKLLKIIESKSE